MFKASKQRPINFNFLTIKVDGKNILWFLSFDLHIQSFGSWCSWGQHQPCVATNGWVRCYIIIDLWCNELISYLHLTTPLFSLAGVHSIAYAFPNVKIITTAVDPEINDRFHVLPGIGNFGDRCVWNCFSDILMIFPVSDILVLNQR